jgi:hypothetical protein
VVGEFRGVSCVTSLHQSVARLRERGKPCREQCWMEPPQSFLLAAARPSLCILFVKVRSLKNRTPSSSKEVKVTIILVVSCLNKHNLVTSITHERFLLPWFSDFHKLQSASAFTPFVLSLCVELIHSFFAPTPFAIREVNRNGEDEI